MRTSWDYWGLVRALIVVVALEGQWQGCQVTWKTWKNLKT